MLVRYGFMRRGFYIGVLTALLTGTSPSAEEPFGVAVVEATDSPISALWRGLQSDIQADERTVVACRADPACGSTAAQRFIAIVDDALRYKGRARIGHINRAVNRVIETTRGEVSWMSPLKALASPGDCKSYAVTKYAVLGAAGIAPEDRRLVMVADRAHPLEKHLVVAVRVAMQWLILDNLTLTLVESTGQQAYQPLHMLDHTGVWDFARPDRRPIS